jgi:vacuolar-type H+-ATPase subunit E/Vma4
LFQESHARWIKNQEEIAPNLISIAFDITEAIIGVKPENSGPVQEKLTSELSHLLLAIDQHTKSTIYISEQDKPLVVSLLNHYEEELTVNVRISDSCEPGEFIFENNEMKAERTFKKLISDFKESLTIPYWS